METMLMEEEKEPVEIPTVNDNELISKLFASPKSKKFRFKSSSGRLLLLEEWVAESRLSIFLPLEMLKLFWKETDDLINNLTELETDQMSMEKKLTISNLLHLLKGKLTKYKKCEESLRRRLKSGVFFKRSTETMSRNLDFSPTNLHIQRFGMKDVSMEMAEEKWNYREFLTSGAYSAISLGSEYGGRFSLKQQMLDVWDKEFCLCSHQFWKWRCFCAKIQSEAKRLLTSAEVICFEHRTIKRDRDLRGLVSQVNKDMRKIQEFCMEFSVFDLPAVENLRNITEGLEGNEGPKLSEFLEISKKMFEIEEQLRKRHIFQFLDQLMRWKIPQMELCSRQEVVLSQAVTTVCTGIMSRFWWWEEKKREKLDFQRRPLVFNILQHLSDGVDERYMIEDSMEAWEMIGRVCTFQLVVVDIKRDGDTVLIPKIHGSRWKLKLEVPVPFNCDRDKNELQVYPLHWNIGIHFRPKSNVPLCVEREVNRRGLMRLESYLENFCREEKEEKWNRMNEKKARMKRLLENWKGENVEKVMFLKLATDIGGELRALTLLNCKSGKDRTGMAVTLEEGRFLRKKCGISTEEKMFVVAKLREDGVRREICAKNTGVPKFKFSSFQMEFLPEPYKPPTSSTSSRSHVQIT